MLSNVSVRFPQVDLLNSTTGPPTSPSMQPDYSWYWIVRGILGVTIVFGNAIIIYLIATRKRLHSTTNWLTLSLAVADFLVGIAVVPASYFCHFNLIAHCNVEILYIFNLTFLYVSVGNLCAITADRFVAARIPYKYYILKRRSCRRWMIALAWIIPIATSCVPLAWQGLPAERRTRFEKVHSTLQFTVFAIFPCFVMLVAYALIYHVTWKQSSQIGAQSRRDSAMKGELNFRRMRRDGRASIRVYGFIVVLFVACWSLSTYRYIRDTFEYGPTPDIVVYISRLLILLNSAGNPVVYSLFKRDIRAELKDRKKAPTALELQTNNIQLVSVLGPSNEGNHDV